MALFYFLSKIYVILNLIEKFLFGFSNEFIHDDQCPIVQHNNLVTPYWDILNCKFTKEDNNFSTNHTQIYENNVFIGISIDAYFGFGISIKIGFNISD